MAKRFMCVSIGVLCLVAAYQVRVERAIADWRPEAGGAVVGGDHLFWFSSGGEAWVISATGWQRQPDRDLPVPANDVKMLFMDGFEGSLMTSGDVAWYWNNATWTEIGPFPGGPVALERESWGGVKARHR